MNRKLKIMKKTLLLLCLTATVNFLFAQSINIGVKGGVNFSQLAVSPKMNSFPFKSLSSATGFHLGAVVDLGLGNWSLQPGVLYSTKGGTWGSVDKSYIATEKLTLNYIEVPINILYNVHVVVGKIFIGGGPYFDYRIAGKMATTGYFSPIYGTETQNLGSGSGLKDQPSYGLNFLGGFRFNSGLSFSVGYELGLHSLLTSNSSVTVKNNVETVSVGYFFR